MFKADEVLGNQGEVWCAVQGWPGLRRHGAGRGSAVSAARPQDPGAAFPSRHSGLPAGHLGLVHHLQLHPSLRGVSEAFHPVEGLEAEALKSSCPCSGT